MTRFILAIGALFICFAGSAQELTPADKSELESRLGTFMDLTAKEDYNGLMDYIYPKLFDFASREQMIEVFSGLEALGIDMIIDKVTIDKIESLHQEGENRYVLGTYSLNARIVLVSDELKTTEAAEQMQAAFALQFAENAVSYDKDNYTININGGIKHLVAVNETKYKGLWYFVEYDQNNPDVLAILLPKEVIDKVNARLN